MRLESLVANLPEGWPVRNGTLAGIKRISGAALPK